MKTLLIAASGAVLAAGSLAMPAEAEASGQFMKSLKKAKKKAEEAKKAAEDVKDAIDTAEDAVQTVTGGSTPTRSSGTSVPSRRPTKSTSRPHVGRAAPAPARLASLTECANLNVGNAFIAQNGVYTFKKGISTEKRNGLIDREPVSPTNGCIMPGLGAGDVLYVEVDKEPYDKFDYKMQCVTVDGKEPRYALSTPPPVDNYVGKDVMLHSGNSLGYEPTATGSNSSRTEQYEKLLASRGRAMITFNMPSLHNDPGTDFYCQYYNETTGKSVVAFTFRRGPGG